MILQIPRERLEFLQTLIVVGVAPPGAVSFADFLRRHSEKIAAAPTCKDDTAFWLYSSGSTGSPKACVHRQNDMVAATEQYALNVLKIRQSDRFFSVAKLFFAYGLGNALYFPLAVGGTAILCPGRPSPQNVFAVIERHRPTLFFSVPSNFASLAEYRRDTGDVRETCDPHAESEFDLSSIRLDCFQGEALPAALYERFTSVLELRFWMELGRRRRCTFSFPILRERYALAPVDESYRVVMRKFSTSRDNRSRLARSETFG